MGEAQGKHDGDMAIKTIAHLSFIAIRLTDKRSVRLMHCSHRVTENDLALVWPTWSVPQSASVTHSETHIVTIDVCSKATLSRENHQDGLF